MRCGTSFFNASVYKNCLKRYWPVWGCLLLGLIFVLPLPVLNAGSDVNARDLILSLGSYCGLAYGFVFPVLAAMVVFSWMYQSKSAGFTGALPLRREAVFVSCALAGFTMVAGPGVAAALLTLLAAGGLCGFAAALALTGAWLAKYLLVCLCFFGFSCLCAHLTGSIWVLPLVYGLLNVAVVVFWYLIANVLNLLLPGFAGDVPDLAVILSPIVQMFTYPWSDQPNTLWLGLAVYAVFGLICAFLGLLLARKRRLETATDTVALEWLKPVFRWVFALGFGLCFANLLFLILLDEGRNWLLMGLFLLLGTFLGWIIAEMLVRKSYKVRSALKTYPILGALVVLLAVYCACGGFGYSRRAPAPSEVEGAVISCYGRSVSTEDPAEISEICAIHGGLIAADTDSSEKDITVTYHLKNGGSVRRAYPREALSEQGEADMGRLMEKHYRSTLEALAADGDVILSLDGDLNADGEWAWFGLDDRESRELVRTAILPDAAAGKVRIAEEWVYNWDTGDGEEYCRVNLNVRRKDKEYYYASYSFLVTPEAQNTWPLLQRYAAEWAESYAD